VQTARSERVWRQAGRAALSILPAACPQDFRRSSSRMTCRRSATWSKSSSYKCPYRSQVIVAEACPSIDTTSDRSDGLLPGYARLTICDYGAVHGNREDPPDQGPGVAWRRQAAEGDSHDVSMDQCGARDLRPRSQGFGRCSARRRTRISWRRRRWTSRCPVLSTPASSRTCHLPAVALEDRQGRIVSRSNAHPVALGFTAAEIEKAYGPTGLKSDGKTVADVEAYGYPTSDLATYRKPTLSRRARSGAAA
jgi:hypothetical protein